MQITVCTRGGGERVYEHVDHVRYIPAGVELVNHANGEDRPRVIALFPYHQLERMEIPGHDSPIGVGNGVVLT